MSHPLDGVHEKLKRAEEHLAALQVEIKSFEDSKLYTFRTERQPNSSTYILSGRLTHAAPLRWSVIIGDFVHNTRSALDHLVYQLALLNPKVITPKWTQFPIFLKKTEYDRKGRPMVRLLLDHHRRAIERLQPYQPNFFGTGYVLAILNKLNNTDKHRLLTVVVNATLLTGVRITASGGKLPSYSVEVLNDGVIEIKETPVTRITFSSYLPLQEKVAVDPEASVKIKFADRDLLNAEIITMLSHVLNRSRRIIRIFDSQFS